MNLRAYNVVAGYHYTTWLNILTNSKSSYNTWRDSRQSPRLDSSFETPGTKEICERNTVSELNGTRISAFTNVICFLYCLYTLPWLLYHSSGIYLLHSPNASLFWRMMKWVTRRVKSCRRRVLIWTSVCHPQIFYQARAYKSNLILCLPDIVTWIDSHRVF